MVEELLKWLLANCDDVQETLSSFALDAGLDPSDLQALARRLEQMGVDVDREDEQWS